MEYTSSEDLILIQSSENPARPEQRRLSRTTPYKCRNRKLRRILDGPYSWNDVDAATYDVLSCDVDPTADPFDIEGAPVNQDSEISLEDTQTPSALWELT